MEQIRIDLVPGGVTPNAHASQYDVGRAIRFLLYNGGSAYTLAGTETITVDVTKPDGSTDAVSVTNTSSNYVDFVTTDGLLNQAGLYPCEISIVNGTDVIGSQNFNLRAEADAYDGADIVTVTVGPADICTFTTTLAEPLQSVIVDIEATGGNGTPDNPIPINGYTEANITRCGVNLWDGTKQDNVGVNATTGNLYASTGTFTTDYIKVAPNTAYYANPTNWKTWACFYDANKTYVNYTSIVNGVINTTAEAVYMRISGDMNEVATASINYPSTDTSYHPYNGDTYTIAFGQTVYGGVLDVTRGKLTVTHGYVDLGALSWTYRNDTNPNAPYFYASTPSTPDNVKYKGAYYATNYGLLCSIYSSVSRGNFPNTDFTMCIDGAGDIPSQFQIKNSNYTDASSFTTAMDGIILVYELATPFDIDLTPEVISAIVGTNNVFADCGETTVKYLKAGA